MTPRWACEMLTDRHTAAGRRSSLAGPRCPGGRRDPSPPSRRTCTRSIAVPLCIFAILLICQNTDRAALNPMTNTDVRPSDSGSRPHTEADTGLQIRDQRTHSDMHMTRFRAYLPGYFERACIRRFATTTCPDGAQCACRPAERPAMTVQPEQGATITSWALANQPFGWFGTDTFTAAFGGGL
jgi:hypothetical protein